MLANGINDDVISGLWSFASVDIAFLRLLILDKLLTSILQYNGDYRMLWRILTTMLSKFLGFWSIANKIAQNASRKTPKAF